MSSRHMAVQPVQARSVKRKFEKRSRPLYKPLRIVIPRRNARSCECTRCKWNATVRIAPSTHSANHHSIHRCSTCGSYVWNSYARRQSAALQQSLLMGHSVRIDLCAHRKCSIDSRASVRDKSLCIRRIRGGAIITKV